MRFHLLAPPNSQTTKEYSLDGFCMLTMRFARILKSLGHTVILYGGEENESPCDEFVPVVTVKRQRELLQGLPYQTITPDAKHPLWRESSLSAVREIESRKQPHDIICTIGGVAHQLVAARLPDLMFVEYSIGYLGNFAPYRVFQSDSWRHFSYGMRKQIMGNNFDAVIPAFFDPTEYPFREKKEDYAIYVGRLTKDKGVNVACRSAKLAGVRLFVVGYGDKSLVTDGAEFVGVPSEADKKELMSKASVLMAPTQYLEPFGMVVPEANFCGTPVITSDFGAFTETVEDGITGTRCHYMGEFVRALQNRFSFNPGEVRQSAVDRFSLDAVAPQYQRYFERLNLLWKDGWNTI